MLTIYFWLQSMMDMRTTLTAEVAEKHDCIVTLRRKITELEEECCQVNKQTQFKDNIIKEMRKEVKRLKKQVYNNIYISVFVFDNF